MQLQLVFGLNEPLLIPFNYNYQVQSAIYSKLREIGESDFWHNDGFGTNGGFKSFVFGELTGKYTIENKMICFYDKISLEIRSPKFEFCDALQRSFELNLCMRFFDTTLEIYCAGITNKHINANKSTFSTISPVVVHETLPNGKTIYFSPENKKFIEGLNRNFVHKYEAVYKTLPDKTYIMPIGEHKKIVTRYKGIWITSYNGQYEIIGNSKSLEFLYNTGIGAKNSQGFGMLNQCS